MDVLAGERLYIEETQICDDAHTLASSITALGGSVVPSRAEATGILVNRSHPSFTPSSSDSPPQITYTWPAHCAAAKTRVDPSTLPAPILLNHWKPGSESVPLTVYVSINLRILRADEDRGATKAAVEAALAQLGALIVRKRAMADVMVVDRKTLFFLDKITAEVKKAGKEWQRFAEREWAEAVVREGRMLPLLNLEGETLPGPEEVTATEKNEGVQAPSPAQQPSPHLPPAAHPASPPSHDPDPPPTESSAALTQNPTHATDVDMGVEGAAAATSTPHRIIRPSSQKERKEEARRQREDSFAEDDVPFFKKAPGRPGGKPRNEYTPEDDDLLCRYLGRYHPNGAWSSRKTFQMMSWLERFKKNSVAFGKRVRRYAEAGLNGSLKTVAERATARERARSRDKSGDGPCMETEAGPSSGKGTEKASERPKRRLALSDDEDDEEPRKKSPPRLSLGRNRPGSGFPTQPPREAREPLFLPGPSEPDAQKAEERAQPPPPVEPATDVKEPQERAVPVSLAAEGPVPDIAAEDHAAAPVLEEPQEQMALETTAVPDQQPPSDEQPSNTKKREDPVATSPPATPEAPTSLTLAALTQAPPSAQLPAASAPSVPPTPTPTQPSAAQPNPTPTQLPSAQPPPSPSASTPRASAVSDLIDRRRTPRRPRPTLTTVTAPHSQPSRRRVLETVSIPGELCTPVPPPREDTSTPTSHAPPPQALTPAELQQKLEAGREIVTQAAQAYRGYIDRWLGLFGIGQAEIMAAVEEVRARTDLTRAPLVFDEVERVLEERYGRV
ncbi:hypothetical protein CspeluHIS016_0900890 [Cutaneotrichosporon spelunceum]|uniref:BRCT domain-containing protein n=1 Tax=Cutaneotrichosporon spelunceum TaxID=1672016 RepID=A0AAD3YFD7_9TREE|nr:hypothetical protein CspeluHIS016_0900890 [Cutaneotrichosporon spelunceum]